MVISAPPVASFTTGGCLQLLWSRWEPFAQEQHPLEILAPASFSNAQPSLLGS